MKSKYTKHFNENTTNLHNRGVYKLYLSNNPDKVYVGSTPSKTSSIISRFRKHYQQLLNNIHHSEKLQRAVNKYGIELLMLDVLEILDDDSDKIIEREQYWINTLNAYKKGFNCTPMAGCTIGFKMPERVVAAKRAPLLQYDIDGNFLKAWASLSEAKKEGFSFNIEALKNNSEYSAGGFIWYRKTGDVIPQKVCPYFKKTSKPVLFYTLDGNFYKSFISVLEAANYFKANAGTLVNALKCNGKARRPIWRNYIVKYQIDENFPKVIESLQKTTGFQFKVSVTDLSSRETIIYDSLRQATQGTGLNRGQISRKLNTGKSITSRKTKIKYIVNKI